MPTLILITAPNMGEAEQLSQGLLKERLAACVNTLPVNSHYWWKGKIEDAAEVLMLVKTERRLIKRINRFILKHHSYEVPEIIALPITEVDPKYLEWIEETVKHSRRKSG